MLSQSLRNFPLRATPLLAYAAGDAFGVFYEFRENKIENVPQELKSKDGWPFGGVSDDTLLSVLTIKSLNKSSPTEAAEEFLRQLHSAVPRLRGLGPTTRTALGLEVKPDERGVIGETNGAIMRTALCGLYLTENRNEWIKALAEVTHKSPKAIECAQIAAGLFAGEEFPDYSDWNPPMQAVVWIVEKANNCAEAFALACSLGGDTDTVAALSGALFAARWPDKSDFYSIPWIKDVAWDEVEEDLMACAEMLVKNNE